MWRVSLLALVAWTCWKSDGLGAQIEKVVLSPIPGVDRVDLYFLTPSAKPVACLILCPGFNGDGKHLLEGKEWQTFAKDNGLALVGLSFASDPDLIKSGKGYYDASMGSGRALLDEIDNRIGKGTPLLLYGFSGGAHFVSSFEEWIPTRVTSWCAYSAAWWKDPMPSEATPPGIVACGELDGERYGASLLYFQRGRSLGKPWCWISLAATGHSPSKALDGFVRDYFKTILGKTGSQGEWRDTELKSKLSPSHEVDRSILSAWLPDSDLAEKWTALHHP